MNSLNKTLRVYAICAGITAVIFLVGSLVSGIGKGGGYNYDATSTAEAQAVSNLYGPVVVTACQKPSPALNKPLPASAKLVVVDNFTHKVEDKYQKALPAANTAVSKADLDYVVCIKTDFVEFGTPDDYVDINTNEVKYHCYHKRQDITLSVINVKTGENIKQKSFRGLENEELPCFSTTTFDQSSYGSTAPASEVMDWLMSN